MCYPYIYMHVGLPADHLAIDENTVYWSKHATPTVYYVPRSDPTSLQTFSTSDSSFVLLSTSPGQQPFPDFGKYMYRISSISTCP